MTAGLPDSLPWTNHPDADRLLATDSLALLIGMLLDQTVPHGKGFPGTLPPSERLGRALDAGEIAAWDPEEMVSVFRGPPAIHRYRRRWPNARRPCVGPW